MKLTIQEQTLFRAYVSHRLHLQVEHLIPEYIHTHHHLREDLEDKGYEEVAEAFEDSVKDLSFIWEK